MLYLLFSSSHRENLLSVLFFHKHLFSWYRFSRSTFLANEQITFFQEGSPSEQVFLDLGGCFRVLQSCWKNCDENEKQNKSKDYILRKWIESPSTVTVSVKNRWKTSSLSAMVLKSIEMFNQNNWYRMMIEIFR